MSWGYRIAFLYTGFAALIGTLIVLSMRERVDLVSENYYEQELEYQHRIDAIDRTRALKGTLTWQTRNNMLELSFPEAMKGRELTGEILFQRPSDARLDRIEKLPAITGGTGAVPLSRLQKGMYRIEISWSDGTGKDYFNEGIIQIN